MKHIYELRKLENEGNVTIVKKIEAEPKCAKKEARDYAKQNPGIYSLQKIEAIEYYFTEKN